MQVNPAHSLVIRCDVGFVIWTTRFRSTHVMAITNIKRAINKINGVEYHVALAPTHVLNQMPATSPTAAQVAWPNKKNEVLVQALGRHEAG